MNSRRCAITTLVCLFAFGAAAQSETPPAFQPEPRPMPASLQVESGLRLETYFTSLTQGGVGLLRLSGESIVDARAELGGETFPFSRLKTPGSR